MERILVQTDRIETLSLAECSEEREVIFMEDRRELCYEIVNTEDVAGAVVDIEQIDEENKEFIVSLHKHFPLLKLGVVSPVRVEGENIVWIDADGEEESAADSPENPFAHKPLVEALCSFINGSFEKNRREHHRFDWILHGYLGAANRTENRYKLRSLSAGGAFLESTEAPPEPGTVTTIRITFQNFQLFTECEVVERRSASSNLPVGFGVRFINLQQKTRDLINKMVNDAVFQILMEPEIEPEVPTLFEEELTTDMMAM